MNAGKGRALRSESGPLERSRYAGRIPCIGVVNGTVSLRLEPRRLPAATVCWLPAALLDEEVVGIDAFDLILFDWRDSNAMINH
jgi:hypothetical protein